MNQDDIERRAERIATLFFHRSDIKHRFLAEIITREINYLLEELGVLERAKDTSCKSPSPKTQSSRSHSHKATGRHHKHEMDRRRRPRSEP